MESLNRMALELADEALDFAEELGIGAVELDSGATVLDFGIDSEGGIEAGLLLAELQTAGLATVQTGLDSVAGAPVAHVELSTDHPALALLCSQKAGWELSVGGFEGLGSGPARALVAEEPEFHEVGYTDAFEFAILAVEADRLPTDAAARQVAERAGVDPGRCYIAAFPAASLAGSVVAAARAPEIAAFRLSELGYDPSAIRSATGSAPVPPVPAEEGTAIARGNDALAYGGRVHLVVEEDSDRFEELPSTATEEYATPFVDIFADAGWDFYEVPTEVFAPAQVTVDVVGGPTRVVGATDEQLLAESFGL